MSNHQETHAENIKRQINIVPVVLALLILASLCIYLVIDPIRADKGITSFKTSVINILAPFYLWLGVAVVGYLLFFVFSKYGNIRLGEEKVEYSTFSWIVMMFCAGMGSSLLYWSVLEWIYYYSAPPMGAPPFSQLAAELSITYGSFHWSIIAWSFFAVGAISLAQRFYIRKKPGLSLTACCERVIGEKNANGVMGKIIEVIFIFGILGGHATTLAFGVPMLCACLAKLTGMEVTFGMQVGMIVFVSMIFIASSWIGLEKGFKNLSDWNAYLGIALAVFVLIFGPTLFEIKAITNSLAYMFQNFLYMSLWTDPIGNSGFPESWTAFYWAWWLGLGPWMWIFTTKISKGRTIREMILGMVICGSLGCWLYFGTMSPAGLFQQLNGTLDLVTTLKEQGPTQTIVAFISSMPSGNFFVFAWLFVGILFLAVTLDSSSYTLAAATTKNLKPNEHPNRMFKMFWAFLIATVPLSFMFANASLSSLQSLAIMTAIPIGILTIFTMISGYLYAKEDFGHLSGAEMFAQRRSIEQELKENAS